MISRLTIPVNDVVMLWSCPLCSKSLAHALREVLEEPDVVKCEDCGCLGEPNDFVIINMESLSPQEGFADVLGDP